MNDRSALHLISKDPDAFFASGSSYFQKERAPYKNCVRDLKSPSHKNRLLKYSQSSCFNFSIQEMPLYEKHQRAGTRLYTFFHPFCHTSFLLFRAIMRYSFHEIFRRFFMYPPHCFCFGDSNDNPLSFSTNYSSPKTHKKSHAFF